MKKLFLFVLVLALALTLTSCNLLKFLLSAGDGKRPAETTNSGQPVETTDNGQPAETTNSGQPIETADNGQPAETTNSGQPIETTDNGQPAETTNSGEQPAETKAPESGIDALLSQGFEKVSNESDSTERTIEELLQALRDGEPMTDSSGADYSSLPQTYSENTEEMAQIQGTTVQFSEEAWVTDKTVETFDMEDFTAEMTPEEKAEWDEMMSKTEEDWAAEFAEMEAEMEELANSMNEDSAGYGDGEDYTGDAGDVDVPDEDEIRQQIEDALSQLPDEYKDMFGDLSGIEDLGDLEDLLGDLLG